MFRAKGSLAPHIVELAYAQQHNIPKKAMRSKQKKGKLQRVDRLSEKEAKGPDIGEEDGSSEPISEPPATASSIPANSEASQEVSSTPVSAALSPIPLSALSIPSAEALPDSGQPPLDDSKTADPDPSPDALYCPECYLPLHPDPAPEKLYIFLHALRYTSASLGAFETRLPEWAAEGYVWE